MKQVLIAVFFSSCMLATGPAAGQATFGHVPAAAVNEEWHWALSPADAFASTAVPEGIGIGRPAAETTIENQIGAKLRSLRLCEKQA